jgi:hypothetical protein
MAKAAEGAMRNYELLDGVLSSLIWTFLTGVLILFRFGSCSDSGLVGK